MSDDEKDRIDTMDDAFIMDGLNSLSNLAWSRVLAASRVGHDDALVAIREGDVDNNLASVSDANIEGFMLRHDLGTELLKVGERWGAWW